MIIARVAGGNCPVGDEGERADGDRRASERAAREASALRSWPRDQPASRREAQKQEKRTARGVKAKRFEELEHDRDRGARGRDSTAGCRGDVRLSLSDMTQTL